uniref:Putative secreted protein n=1 Tax=Rhipicephalus microplus TaxID=6941 RepID=A0A6M2DEQ4_RHIMP
MSLFFRVLLNAFWVLSSPVYVCSSDFFLSLWVHCSFFKIFVHKVFEGRMNAFLVSICQNDVFALFCHFSALNNEV